MKKNKRVFCRYCKHFIPNEIRALKFLLILVIILTVILMIYYILFLFGVIKKSTQIEITIVTLIISFCTSTASMFIGSTCKKKEYKTETIVFPDTSLDKQTIYDYDILNKDNNCKYYSRKTSK